MTIIFCFTDSGNFILVFLPLPPIHPFISILHFFILSCMYCAFCGQKKPAAIVLPPVASGDCNSLHNLSPQMQICPKPSSLFVWPSFELFSKTWSCESLSEAFGFSVNPCEIENRDCKFYVLICQCSSCTSRVT